jgi:hypothetical protein
VNEHGYGIIRGNGKGSQGLRVSRVIYEALKGPIPEGKRIRHTCDNPPCVNHLHLLYGTAADNSRDMAVRGRAWSKLTKEEVIQIRELRKQGWTLQSLVEKFGMSRSQIKNIIYRKQWRHLP